MRLNFFLFLLEHFEGIFDPCAIQPLHETTDRGSFFSIVSLTGPSVICTKLRSSQSWGTGGPENVYLVVFGERNYFPSIDQYSLESALSRNESQMRVLVRRNGNFMRLRLISFW